MNKSKAITRRSFLGAAAITGAPLILPAGVLAQRGRPGANDRIVTGHIGLGMRGRRLLDYFHRQAGALCDVDAQHLQKASAKTTGPHAFLCSDFRRILDRPDIDAVIIATPNHWHAEQARLACEAGKDVYLETPTALELLGARELLQRAQRNACIIQSGATGSYTPAVQALRERLRSLGNEHLQAIQAFCANPPLGGEPGKNQPPPPQLDWERWLGPALHRPYNPDLSHTLWRWMRDLGGGQLLNQGVHLLSAIFYCLDIDTLGKVKIDATAKRPDSGLWDAPRDLQAEIKLPAHQITIRWNQRDAQPGQAASGATFSYGEESVSLFRGDALSTSTLQEEVREEIASPLEQALTQWQECIRERRQQEKAFRQVNHATTLANLLNLSARLQRPLTWEDETGNFVKDEQAARLRSAPQRGSWKL